MRKLFSIVLGFVLLLNISSMMMLNAAAEEDKFDKTVETTQAAENEEEASADSPIPTEAAGEGETAGTSEPDEPKDEPDSSNKYAGGIFIVAVNEPHDDPASNKNDTATWSVLAFVVSLVSLYFSYSADKKAKWANAKDFFDRFDSFQARESRKRVYETLKDLNDIDGTYKAIIDKSSNKSDKSSNKSIEDDVTYTISMYDAYTRMIKEKALPNDMLEESALWTAVNFFVLTWPYIQYRRKSDNPYYASYLTAYFQDECVQKKVNALKENIPDNQAANELIEKYKRVCPPLPLKQRLIKWLLKRLPKWLKKWLQKRLQKWLQKRLQKWLQKQGENEQNSKK